MSGCGRSSTSSCCSCSGFRCSRWAWPSDSRKWNRSRRRSTCTSCAPGDSWLTRWSGGLGPLALVRVAAPAQGVRASVPGLRRRVRSQGDQPARPDQLQRVSLLPGLPGDLQQRPQVPAIGRASQETREARERGPPAADACRHFEYSGSRSARGHARIGRRTICSFIHFKEP